MRDEEVEILKRRIDKQARRQSKIVWFGVCLGLGAQVPSLVLGFIVSWTRGLQSIAQAALGMTIWIPIMLHLRKTSILSNASSIATALISGMRSTPATDDDDRDPFDGLMCNLVIMKVGLLAWGTPEGKWKNGCDPYHSHPDDRRRRLMELLTIAAWRDLPEVPWDVRQDMIALAQICIAAEAVQSRSVTGRIRNGLLRAFARRDPSQEIGHIVPVADEESAS